MTKATSEPTYATAIRDGLTVPSSTSNKGAARVLKRGDELALTDEFLNHTRDRSGATVWPSIVLDKAAQAEAWGAVMLVPGRLAENPELARAIATEREEAALSEHQRRLLEARRYGKGVRQ